ncbi:hypothetical protein ABU113_13325 [Sphingosinicellaceae bacterium M-36]
MAQASFRDAMARGRGAASAVVVRPGPFAGRVAGQAWPDIAGDPALQVPALGKVTALLGGDALVIDIDPAAAPGVVEAAVETANRLSGEGATPFARVVTITGLLAGHAGGAGDTPGEAERERMTALVEQVCKARPDLVLLLEGAALGTASVSIALRKLYNTLRNVAGYFNVPLGVMLSGYPAEAAAEFAKLKLDAYVLGADAAGNPPTPDALAALATEAAVGLALPFDRPDVARAWVAGLADCQPLLLLNDDLLAADSSVEDLRALVSDLKQPKA